MMVITYFPYFLYNLLCICDSAIINTISLIKFLIYFSLKQFSRIPPIEPKGFLDISKDTGVAQASINPPI